MVTKLPDSLPDIPESDFKICCEWGFTDFFGSGLAADE